MIVLILENRLINIIIKIYILIQSGGGGKVVTIYSDLLGVLIKCEGERKIVWDIPEFLIS